MQEGDSVGDIAGKAHLVGRDKHRHTDLFLQLPYRLEDLTDQLRIECTRHLVQQERPRVRNQRPHDRHSLLLTA